jgi:hypothetical protein
VRDIEMIDADLRLVAALRLWLGNRGRVSSRLKTRKQSDIGHQWCRNRLSRLSLRRIVIGGIDRATWAEMA